MNGMRQSRRRWLVLAALGGVLAIMAVGAGIALAVNLGTAGELSYHRTERFEASGNSEGNFATADCPGTRHVTGGGVKTTQSDLDVVVNQSYPVDDADAGVTPDDGWRVGVNVEGDTGARFAVYAICDD